MSRAIHWSFLLLFLFLAFASLYQSPALLDPDNGKDKKSTSGYSFEKETFVRQSPAASQLSAAWNQEAAWSAYDDWEPAIAADRSSSWVYQMTTRYNGPAPCKGCPMPVIIFRSSSNGGASWNADKFLNVSKKKQNDPEIEVASDGAIYAVWLDDYTPGIKFTKSTNRGATWSTPIQFTGKGLKPSWNDKPILAISSNGQHVYIAMNASDSYVAASHNYGATFSPLVKTSNDTRYWFHTAGAVANNGTVYFAAVDYSQDYTGDSYINVLKSTDGSNWTTTRVDTSKEMPPCAWSAGCYLGFFGPTAGLAVDGNGSIMLAYNAGDVAGGPQKLWMRTSTNGTSWSARTELSNGSSAVNNVFPVVAAGTSAGDFRVAWQDDRNGSTAAWNTWYKRTGNGGATWSGDLRISDQTSGAPYKSAAGYVFPYGDYFEMAVDGAGKNHAIWGEGISYTGPGGTWYTSGQ